MTNIKFQPFGQRIVVKPDEDEEKKGKIHIPGTAKKDVVKGTVIAVGQMVGNEALAFAQKVIFSHRALSNKEVSDILDMCPKAGYRVRFLAHCGNEIEVDGEKYLLLHENEVLGRYI